MNFGFGRIVLPFTHIWPFCLGPFGLFGPCRSSFGIGIKFKRFCGNYIHNLTTFENLALSCLFETFPGVVVGGWIEILILMKTQSSTWTWTLDFVHGLRVCQPSFYVDMNSFPLWFDGPFRCEPTVKKCHSKV